jgi:hypothetical protein
MRHMLSRKEDLAAAHAGRKLGPRSLATQGVILGFGGLVSAIVGITIAGHRARVAVEVLVAIALAFVIWGPLLAIRIRRTPTVLQQRSVPQERVSVTRADVGRLVCLAVIVACLPLTRWHLAPFFAGVALGGGCLLALAAMWVSRAARRGSGSHLPLA